MGQAPPLGTQFLRFSENLKKSKRILAAKILLDSFFPAGNRKESERIGKNQKPELIRFDSQESEKIGKNREKSIPPGEQRGCRESERIGKNQLIPDRPQAPKIDQNRFPQHPELLKMRGHQQESAKDQQMCKEPLAPG